MGQVDTPGFWTPGSRLDSTRGPAATRGVQLQGFEFAVFQAGSGGRGFRVASQKSGPVASDVPRFARQHTFSAGKEPYNQWVRSFFSCHPVTVFTRKTVSINGLETVFMDYR
jgi:hypothetical protein